MKKLTVKETAAAVRKRLRTEFPGVKFSVRMSGGTGYGWMHCNWTDGPTVDQVRAITCTYVDRVRGMYGDEWVDAPITLSTGEQVLANCDGILTGRSISPAGHQWARTTTGHAGQLDPGKTIEGEGHAEMNTTPWVLDEENALTMWLGGVDLTHRVAAN